MLHSKKIASQAQLSALDTARAATSAAAFAFSAAKPKLFGEKLLEAAKDGQKNRGFRMRIFNQS